MKKNVGISYKAFAVILAAVLVLGGTIGGTMAWLIDDTEAVENTFTYGDINIVLAETTGTAYKIVPGVDLMKDPKVTVNAGSEDCWLFVKVEEANWPAFTEDDGTTKKVAYSIAAAWTALEGHEGVYYREVKSPTTDASFSVLKDDKITVSENLKKTEIDTVKNQKPELTFTAYAVQKAEIASVTVAWEKAEAEAKEQGETTN